MMYMVDNHDCSWNIENYYLIDLFSLCKMEENKILCLIGFNFCITKTSGTSNRLVGLGLKKIDRNWNSGEFCQYKCTVECFSVWGKVCNLCKYTLVYFKLSELVYCHFQVDFRKLCSAYFWIVDKRWK